MKIRSLLLIPLMAMVLSGCGGGDEPEESSVVASSAEESYTISWNNWDGTALEVDENVKKDSMPSYDGATPTRPNDTT